MIKIEFKEAHRGHVCIANPNGEELKLHFEFSDMLRAVLPYIPTQDPMLDRSNILVQLGITKEQDEANQIEWAKI